MNLAELKARQHYVYRAWDINGRLLYIGCSIDVKKRLADHKVFGEWFALMTNVAVEGPYSYEEARSIEWEAIQTERSLYNAMSPEWNDWRSKRTALWHEVNAAALSAGEAPSAAAHQAVLAIDVEMPSFAEFVLEGDIA